MSQGRVSTIRILLLATSVAALGATSPGEAIAGSRAKVTRTRPAVTGRTDAPLAVRKQQNEALIGHLEAKKGKATDRAEREVSGWSNRKLAKTGWKKDQREKAVKQRAKQIFGRHDKRLLDAAGIIRDLIAAEEAAPEIGDQKKLQGQQFEIQRSALANRKMGIERQALKKLRRVLHKRLPRLTYVIGKRVPFFRRDTQLDPGLVAGNLAGEGPSDLLDPEDSTMWKRRPAKRTSAWDLNQGPWLKPEKRPTMPDEATVLELDEFRSLDGDGTHPSVVVNDPATNTEWKVKFLGNGGVSGDKYLSSDTVASRLLYAMGYHTSVAYHVGSAKMDPRAVIAAFTHKPRVGIRIPENNPLGLQGRKIGHTMYKMRNFITHVKLKNGRVLKGRVGYKYLASARSRPELLDTIDHVEVHDVDLALKEGGDTSIGPFDPDDAPHVDRREMRALSIAQLSWLHGRDIKPSNVRLDVDTEDGQVELVHRLSDTGAALDTVDPNRFGWTVGINPKGARLHTDANGYTLRALDRTTVADARWAVRQIAKLSEEQIMASVATGSKSWPVVKLYTEKLISRRDDLVKTFNLHNDPVNPVKLLRPDGVNRKLNVKGPGEFKVKDADGNEQTIKVAEGAFKVVNGLVVAK
jgi:hypothetical protein